MRLRNSCGSESSASSTTLAKCSRFIFHPLNKGTLTPSSRRFRHHRQLFYRRLRLPLRPPPRRALAEGGHRHLTTDQEGLSRAILDVIGSCPNGTPEPLANAGIPNARREQLFERGGGADPDVG